MKLLSVFIYFLFASTCLCTQKPRECSVSHYQSDYTGNLSTTVTGRTCQRWDSQTPHEHSWTDGRHFPDGSLQAAANHCRSPDEHEGGAWCYTTDPDVRWDYCAVPTCHDFPDCRLTELGGEYRGSLARSASGRDCLPWADEFETLPENFCRNPDEREGGPWCFVAEDGEWEACDVPYCKPSARCVVGDGVTYAGTAAVTVGGYVCQRWDAQHPHTHDYTDPDLFPGEESLTDVENYCRNPGGEETAPWCFTTSPDRRWDYCSLPQCQDCKYNRAGKDYGGTLAQTQSGVPCQRWDAQSPHPHPHTNPDRFPDMSLSSAANFCRNPDGREGGPWCFTDRVGGPEWGFCDVPFCNAADCRDGSAPEQPRPRLAKHVLHIGVDGLDPCFMDAPGGLPNIAGRLMAEGTYTVSGARNVMPVWSGPNWGGILSNMNVHNTGITGNGWGPPWRGVPAAITPVTGGRVPLPTTAWHLRSLDETVRTAYFYNWDWLKNMASFGVPGSLHKEHYCSIYMNDQTYRECDEYVLKNATAYLRDAWLAADTSYTFFYLTELDEVGHRLTWCRQPFLDYVDVIDAQLGELLDVVDEMDLWDDVLVIVGTDHGGSGFSHGTDDDNDMPIPMFLRGPGIKKNHTLPYTPRNYDMGATAVYALGYQPNPWWNGKVIYDAFEV